MHLYTFLKIFLGKQQVSRLASSGKLAADGHFRPRNVMLCLPPAEEWRDAAVIKFSYYLVSNYGRIWSKVKNVCLPGNVSPDGYLILCLTRDDGSTRSVSMHKLVATIFIGPKPSKSHTIDHIDRNRSNNCAWNLRWASYTEQINNRDSSTSRQGRNICQFSPNGQPVFRWNRIIDAATYYGITENQIQQAVLKGHLSAGFYWVNAESVETAAGENFAVIPEYPTYMVSNMGRVKFPTGRITYGTRNRAGYMYVTLSNTGSRKGKYVHILVMNAFIGPSTEGIVVNHLNGQKDDNRLENLEYTSQRENVNHAVETGLRKTPRGSDSKLAIPVVRYNLDGTNPFYFGSILEASAGNRGLQTSITCVCKGKVGRKTAGGYLWRYWRDVAQLYPQA